MKSNTDLRSDVEFALEWEPGIDADQINMDTRGNKVILISNVSYFSERDEAEARAWAAPVLTTD